MTNYPAGYYGCGSTIESDMLSMYSFLYPWRNATAVASPAMFGSDHLDTPAMLGSDRLDRDAVTCHACGGPKG